MIKICRRGCCCLVKVLLGLSVRIEKRGELMECDNVCVLKVGGERE